MNIKKNCSHLLVMGMVLAMMPIHGQITSFEEFKKYSDKEKWNLLNSAELRAQQAIDADRRHYLNKIAAKSEENEKLEKENQEFKKKQNNISWKSLAGGFMFGIATSLIVLYGAGSIKQSMHGRLSQPRF